MTEHNILIFGLPGTGKTTLAKHLSKKLNAVHLNGDELRAILPGLGYSKADRETQAKRVGALAAIISRAGIPVIIDIVCPTNTTRALTGATFHIWINRTPIRYFEDTSNMWETPTAVDMILTDDQDIDKFILDIIRKLHA